MQGSGREGGGISTTSRLEAARLAGIRRPPQCRRCELVVDDASRYCPRCGAARTEEALVGAAVGGGGVRSEGWFPDPFDRLAFRWWDGSQWTAYGSDHDVRWDPLSFEDPTPPGVRGVGIATVGFVVGVAAAIGITALLHSFDEPGGRATLLVLSELGLWSGLIAACVLVTVRRGSRSLVTDYGLRLQCVDVPIAFAGLVAGRLAGTVVALPVIAAFPDLDPPSGGIYGTGRIDTIEWIALVVVVCIGAPIVEELFFRGLVQTRLVGRYGAVIGIAVTSLLFGAAHLIGWVGPITIVYAVTIAGTGAVLGILRHVTGRLGPSIATHMLVNIQAVLLVALLR